MLSWMSGIKCYFLRTSCFINSTTEGLYPCIHDRLVLQWTKHMINKSPSYCIPVFSLSPLLPFCIPNTPAACSEGLTVKKTLKFVHPIYSWQANNRFLFCRALEQMHFATTQCFLWALCSAVVKGLSVLSPDPVDQRSVSSQDEGQGQWRILSAKLELW